MLLRAMLLSCAAMIVCVTATWGANSIVVESKTVLGGEASVTVGVFLENDVPLSAVIIPLEIRTVSGGAYMSGSLNAYVQGRWMGSGLKDWYDIEYSGSPEATNSCSGPVSQSWNTGSGAPPVDYISPDAIYPWGLVTSGINLPPGTDPGIIPSVLMWFDAGNQPGSFEIDTCCTTPTTHLLFVDQNSSGFVPSFTKGVITVDEAANDHPGDVNCDGVVNVIDVVICVNTAFRNSQAPAPCVFD